jgi:hypothetical protein
MQVQDFLYQILRMGSTESGRAKGSLGFIGEGMAMAFLVPLTVGPVKLSGCPKDSCKPFPGTPRWIADHVPVVSQAKRLTQLSTFTALPPLQNRFRL